MIDQRSINCSSCQTQLKADKILKKLIYTVITYIFIMLGVTAYIIFSLEKQGLGIVVLCTLTIPIYFLEKKAWKEGNYEKQE